MKAIQFKEVGGPDVMKLVEVATPEVRPGMVRMRVHAAGINFADTFFREGNYLIKPKLPDTPGMEAAGVIDAVGAGVEGLSPGMRIAAVGLKAYAEYALFHANQVIPLPDFVSFEEGAAFPIQTLTAWFMIHAAHHMTPGQTVLVHSAAGGVGIVAMQIAKAAGARVIGTVSSDSKFAIARQYGADEVINYETHDFAEEAKRLTGGKGVNLILDAVGKPTFDKGIACAAPFGHVILYGRAGGPPDKLDVFRLFEKSVKVSGFVLYTASANHDLMREGTAQSFALMKAGKLKLHIGKSFPLAEAPAAHRFIQSRGSVGKLVLIP
ncbi:MAG TPA: quinone oxidoreductase [Candidatus Binataceae bacterium]|nr:quinone oxidoreductase [Candidatus Binataceae bacterium]HVC44967.1 quinone oxidoreductase [Candidatus Binataceae bacterium]